MKNKYSELKTHGAPMGCLKLQLPASNAARICYAI